MVCFSFVSLFIYTFGFGIKSWLKFTRYLNLTDYNLL